jgi:hypothetical protein
LELELLLEELPQVGEGGLHKQQQGREQTVTAGSQNQPAAQFPPDNDNTHTTAP